MDPDVKEEFDKIGRRLDNVEGYFDEFGKTLNNHMTDYDQKLNNLGTRFTWGFWVIFGLTTAAIAGLVAGAIALLITVL